ncbi:transposase, partial [Bifidobacterium pseudolongum subsp. globosum]
PRAATSKGGWWWTHLPLRRAYLRLERLFKDGTLFCFLDPALTTPGSVPRDGNRLEGGLNAALKRMLVNHRGLPEAHMRRACEWHCYMHSAKPDPALILKQHGQDAKTGTNHDNNDDEPMSQPILGTGIDWNEFHTAARYPNTTD